MPWVTRDEQGKPCRHTTLTAVVGDCWRCKDCGAGPWKPCPACREHVGFYADSAQCMICRGMGWVLDTSRSKRIQIRREYELTPEFNAALRAAKKFVGAAESFSRIADGKASLPSPNAIAKLGGAIYALKHALAGLADGEAVAVVERKETMP